MSKYKKYKNKRRERNTVLYFAYGSNMDQSRLERRVGRVVNLGKAELYDAELLFDVGVKQYSFANVGNKKGSTVEGVLYRLTTKQMRILDSYEGLYDRYQVKVLHNGEKKFVTIYWSIYGWQFNHPWRPTDVYMHHLIKGAKDNELSGEYLDILRNVKTIPYHTIKFKKK